jgi:sugar-specific transcriptional regulator TrmB
MAVTSDIEERVVAAMKSLGFTATDAKTYIALLRSHPATGYEIAARSTVPRSAIYGVLRRLQSLGLANAIEEKPARYIPLPPEKLFELLESRFTRNLASFRTALDQVVGPAAEVATWTVVGYKQMMEQAERLIAGATHSVHASIWRREATALARPLAAARDDGRAVVLFSFTDLSGELGELGELLSYGIDESALEGHWPHKLILVADNSRVLVGHADLSEENRAVVSEEPALVEIAVANLVLDITLFGERKKLDTGPIVSRLTTHLAPLEQLIET